MRRKNTTSETMMGYLAEGLLALLKDKSYEEITIGEIARKAGVNRSTYYRHFRTKEDVVRYYLDSIMVEYQEKFVQRKSQEFSEYLLTMFQTFYSHREHLILLHRAGLTACLLDVLWRQFQFEKLVSQADTEQAYRVSYHMGGIYHNLLLWFSREMRESPEEMTKTALSSPLDMEFTLFHI